MWATWYSLEEEACQRRGEGEMMDWVGLVDSGGPLGVGDGWKMGGG